ncbi:MAG: hypothetical protein GIX03_16015 [Candidatus Eremiobacteraeota bacterium]|nr:hypothetical protein [Candidatus Eremiobacteraeota bacterium]MBC5804469.1 hypothetical protein [Candidatus Eremiobacteraeota bacterium]MBC5821226.1 hypothetical protein [Candidatus Eremiobacteraeota bacterium]
MATPQTGIFALGDAAHAFLEFTHIGGSEEELVRTGSTIPFGSKTKSPPT